MTRERGWFSLAWLVFGLILSSCASSQFQDFQIRQRAYTYEGKERLSKDYKEEYKYIADRRHTNDEGSGTHGNSKVPPGLIGLAFSGGGIRSATFHLGLLQALQEMDKLGKFDYLSTVSGGSYIAGWMVGHLGQTSYPHNPNTDKDFDEFGYKTRASNPQPLLTEQGDFILRLRDQSGFIKKGGFWDGFELVGSYLWRLPLYWIWDVMLHLKTPFVEVGNGLHLFNPYRDRLELTYLQGTPAQSFEAGTLQNHIGPSWKPPYLIVNGNLVNSGTARGHSGLKDQSNFNFEFTPHFVGSDGLGYVEATAFGLPVEEVLNERKELAEQK